MRKGVLHLHKFDAYNAFRIIRAKEAKLKVGKEM